MPIERKLAAIMFTDIAGYTAQMSKDEAVAISLLNKKESVLKPLIAKHNGTYVKSTLSFYKRTPNNFFDNCDGLRCLCNLFIVFIGE